MRVNKFISRGIKRLVEFSIALLLLFAALPALVLFLVAIRIETGHSPLVRTRCVGQHGRWFYRYSYLITPTSTPTGMPAPNRSGHFVAQCGFQNLPQLLNVLRGELSLVGPTCLAETDLRHVDAAIALDGCRLAFPPGILTPIGAGGSLDVLRKGTSSAGLETEIEYVNRWSLIRDLDIVFRRYLRLI